MEQSIIKESKLLALRVGGSVGSPKNSSHEQIKCAGLANSRNSAFYFVNYSNFEEAHA
jgi:hypothetical protein